ncbi:hypothetical protein, partial [Geodermatophilus chilensis]|uniref:hypothetical protein n=1 Tax=Geodermatophilus chilensis TaxID=2035835 RepID=UPI001E4F883B
DVYTTQVLGLGLGLLVVAVDLRVFAAVGTDGPGFTAVETARSGALLAAPLLATATAAVALPAPLAAAAVLMAAAALVSTLLRDAAPSPAPVAPDLVPVPEVLDEPAR